MISRVESGSAAAELTALDLSELVADFAELYEPVAEEAGFATRIDVQPGIRIRGNRELLSQALSNLAENALKYGFDENGVRELAISVSADRGQATVDIADRGPGIAAADRERATERFARLEQSRTLPGNGLGLSLVRAVAELHGGKLVLDDNAPGLRARMIVPIVMEAAP
jgi:signal transduction histidine kinase